MAMLVTVVIFVAGGLLEVTALGWRLYLSEMSWRGR